MKKTVLITGASGGIGKSIIEVLKDNYNLILQYNETIISYEDCLSIKCDLRSEEEIDNMLNIIYEKYDNIDILINNAAIEYTTDLKDKTKESFMETLDVNLIAPFLLSKKIGLKMFDNKYGKIINITSNNAINKYDPSTLEYDASKAGLISLTHNLANYFSPYVNVNAIAPGWVKTDKIKKLDESLDNLFIEEESKKILKERFAEPIEVAYLVDFLCSNKADYINDEIIKIDGGTK